MELTEYYLNLVDQFFLVETLGYENDQSVDILFKAVEEIVITMKIITQVYPEFQRIWSGSNLAKELSDLEEASDMERRKELFYRTKVATMICSKVVIPRFGGI